MPLYSGGVLLEGTRARDTGHVTFDPASLLDATEEPRCPGIALLDQMRAARGRAKRQPPETTRVPRIRRPAWSYYGAAAKRPARPLREVIDCAKNVDRSEGPPSQALFLF